MRVEALLLVVSALGRGNAVRMAEEWDVDMDLGNGCTGAMNDLLAGTSYRNLFSPVLVGKHQLRHTTTGVFAASQGGSWKASKINDERTHINLQGVTRDRSSSALPMYTLTSAKSEDSLLSDLNTTWQLVLGPRGSTFALRASKSGKFLSVVNDVVTVGDTEEQWSLVPLASSKRSWFKGRKDHVQAQWDAVREIPVMPGRSAMTWEKVCRGGDGCSEWYRTERDRQKMLGRTAETGDDLVTDNRVVGLCDWTLEGLRAWVHSPEVITEMANAAGGQCPTDQLEFSQALAVTLEDRCVGKCESTVAEHVKNVPCSNSMHANWEKSFEEIIAANPACGRMPPDVLSGLAEYHMEQKCMVWYKPSLFWVPQDSMAKDGVASLDNREVCSLRHFDRFSQDPLDIVQEGSCPEGSSCKCPQLHKKNVQTIAEYRSGDVPAFTPDLSSYVAAFKAQVEDDYWGDGVNEVVLGLVTAAPMAIPSMLHELTLGFATTGYVTSMFLGVYQTYRDESDSFACEETVGCWPDEPVTQETKLSSKACRVPDTAKSGGSPFWFLPPPMLVLRRGWFGCSLKPCTQEEVTTQKVGFGRDANTRKSSKEPNVYNCQPLTASEMTTDQKTKFAQKLSCTGAVDDEYSLPKDLVIDRTNC